MQTQDIIIMGQYLSFPLTYWCTEIYPQIKMKALHVIERLELALLRTSRLWFIVLTKILMEPVDLIKTNL